MELKSNFGKGTFEADRSIIDKMQTEMKSIFFTVVRQMLKQEEQSIWINGLAIIIQFMQVTYIPFNRKIWKVWQHEDLTTTLNKIFGYFLLTPYFEHKSYSGFVAMLYVSLGLMVLLLMLVFLLSYTFSKSKSSFTWPIFLLRVLAYLFTTILYMPIIDLLLSMVACKSNGIAVMHQLFDNQECWTNIHIVHGIVAIIGLVLFFSLTIFFALLYYEPRYVPNDATSRFSGRAIAIFMFYELILVICYTFMDESTYDYLQIIIMLTGSFIVFWKIHVEAPISNVPISKLWSMLVALNMWTVTLLCFSKFLEGILFFGTVYAWIAGLPLMIIAVLRSDKQHYELLLLNLNKVQDADQVLALTNHLLKLHYKSSQNQNSSLLLDGFLEIHRATCSRDDCYLKIKKQPNQRYQKPVFKENTVSERDIDLLMVIGQIYFNSIKKFPNDIMLRIRYAFFLYDQMKQKQQALNELTQAEQLCPSLDNEFVIFRYKKIIEDEMNQQQNESLGNLDVMSEIAFQNNMRQFQNKIERATLMHMDFWSQLQEDSPDLGKLNDIGAKINLSIAQVDELWNKMQKGTMNVPKAMRLYGKFIIEVLQDKDYGEDLMDKARNLQLQYNKMKNKQAITLISGEDIGFESNPIVLVSTSSDKFASINNLNLACCNIFGYHKSEMLNRKVNILMPNLYAKFHDYHIDHYLQSAETRNTSKERLVYIKQKSNYILPAFINLKIIQSQDENIQIAAQFKLQKQVKPTCYLLLDRDEVIDSISASCIPLLNVDSKQVFHKKTAVSEIFPNFPDQRDQFLKTKQGTLITYNFQQQDVDEEMKEEVMQFMCFLTEILNENQDQVVGYIMKLELYSGEQQNISGEMQVPMPKAHVSHTFQIKFNPNKQLYCGEYQPGSENNSARVDQTIIWDPQDQSSMVSLQQVDTILKSQVRTDKTEENKEHIEKINYAEGIKILRLFENRIQDIDDKDDYMSEEDEALQGRSVFQRAQDQENEAESSLNDFNNIFRSRKNLSNVVNNYQTPQVISQLSWTTNLLILVMVTISFVDFFITQKQYDDIYDTILLVRDTNLRNSELGIIMSSVQNLQMLNMGVFNITTKENITKYETEQKSIMNVSIQNVDSLNKRLMLQGMFISDELNELQTKDVVSMKFGTAYVKYDIMEATQQIISKALNIRDKPLANIKQSDDDVTFFTFNLLNDLVYQLRNSSTLYANGLKYKTVEKKQVFEVILGLSASALGVGLLLLILIMLQVTRTQEMVLSMFLDIPDKTVKYLYNKCENFISNLQVGEEEEVLSEMEDLEKEEQEELNRTLKSKKKKKKFKNTNASQRNFLFIFLVIISILQAYFIFNYFMSEQLMSNLHQLVPEINATARAESFYRFSDNVERSLYMNRNMTILNDDSYKVCKSLIDQLYALDSSMHQEHSINVDITNSIYASAFKQIFMLEPCDILANVMKEVTYTECQEIADGALFQGMAVGMARYFENLRYIMTIYDQFWDNPKANFTTLARGFATLKNITQNTDFVTNNILNLNNFNQSKESRIIQHSYNRGTYRYLINQMILGIDDDIQKSKTQRLALFIVFEVILFIIYFIMWLPLQLKLTRDIWRTRSMIIMIPLRVIQRIKSIKAYIRDFLHARDIQV